MTHLLLIADDVIQRIDGSKDEMMKDLKDLVTDLNLDVLEKDTYGIEKGMVYVDGPSGDDPGGMVYFYIDEGIKPFFELDLDEMLLLKRYIDLGLEKKLIGMKERIDAGPQRMEEKCGDCGAHIGEEHWISCDLESCTVCGGQRLGCTCEGHDPWEARWKGWEDGNGSDG